MDIRLIMYRRFMIAGAKYIPKIVKKNGHIQLLLFVVNHKMELSKYGPSMIVTRKNEVEKCFLTFIRCNL
jgi:hypothetical protein